MKVCDVLIQDAFLHNRHLTYQCDGFDVSKGKRVSITLRNREIVGFVMRVYEAEASDFDFELIPIIDLIDESVIVNDELYQLALDMSYRNVSPLISCLQTILPNTLNPKKNFHKAKMIPGIRFQALDDKRLTPMQSQFIKQFKDKEFVTLKNAREFYSGYNSLVVRNIFKKVEKESRYVPQEIKDAYPKPVLSDQQQSVINQVRLDQAHTYLLHGVTGSGKTEVYLHLAEKVIEKGQSVLFLVPEIALTPQMIARVSARFKEDVAIYHSGLNNQEKYEQYLRVQNRETAIVVGTRSALFMPFKDLGLIVIDEEHDPSYKQSQAPTYHALDVANFRSKYHQCPMILGSASPRLESYARAVKGVYTLLELPSRINDCFPKVSIIDTKETLYKGQGSLLTPALKEAIQLRLERQEQVILLLNRRGYMTFLKDEKTDQVLMCPHCDVSLNYHKHDNVLKCHQCDYVTQHIPLGSDGKKLELVGSGVGTQRLVEGLQKHFSQAKILRMDRDSTSKKGSHKKMLEDFSNHKYDILVGTQMIAKGLDIENVTLVGILNIDHTLAREDFRSVEETFNLILQAAGRSGRGEKPGEVMIQTFNKDHYAVQFGIKNQYIRFFNQEMKYRSLANYPPYSYLISITFSGEALERVFENATTFLNLLKHDKMNVMGPSSLYKLKDLQRVRIILKGKDLDAMIEEVNHAVELYYSLNKGGLRVDVNPLTLM